MSFSGRFSDYPRLEIPVGDKLKRVAQIVRKHDGQILWQRKCINLVPISTTTDGKTIYNGIGYKDHVVKWADKEEEAQNYGIVTTGYFPAKAEDVISVKGINWQDGIGFNVASAYNGTNNAAENLLAGFKKVAYMNCWYDNVYTNQLPSAKDLDGTIYNGIGYKKGIRYTSSGTYVTDVNCCLSGIIEVQNYDMIYLRNIIMNKNVNNEYCRLLYYTKKKGWARSEPFDKGSKIVHKFDENGNLVYLQVPNWGEIGSEGAISKIRIQCSYIGLDSIITINAPANKDIEFTNLIESAINPDGTPYVGDNGEKGYKRGYRLDSSNVELTNSNMFCTGYIPVDGYHTRYYCYNIWHINKSTQGNTPRCYLYNANFEMLSPYFSFNDCYSAKDSPFLIGQGVIFTQDGSFYSFTPASTEYWKKNSNVSDVAYMRITSENTSEDPVIVKIVPIPRQGKAYTNQIPISTNFDGSIYNEIGYKTGTHYRYDSTSKVKEYSTSKTEVPHPLFTTGRIPISNGDIVRLKNCYIDCSANDSSQVDMYGTSNGNIVNGFSNGSGYSYSISWSSFSNAVQDIVKDEKNRVTQFTFLRNDSDITHMSLTLAPTHTPADAIITINEEIYDPGNFNIHLKNSLSSATHARISGYGDGRNLIVTVNDEITELPKTKTYTNRVPLSTESDGVTIYNNGLGYMNGSRISSSDSGAVCKQSDVGVTHTGFIPVRPGQTIRIAGALFHWNGVETAINTYDSTFTANGQVTYGNGDYGIFAKGGNAYGYRFAMNLTQERTGVWAWKVPPANSQDKFTVSYIRVTAKGFHTGTNGPNIPPGDRLIVTVDEPIND